MKNLKNKVIILFVAFVMIIPLSLASIFATGEVFQYQLDYVLSDDQTYATINLELIPTENIEYTSITDVNGNEENLNSTSETITRNYKVTSNKEYSLQVKYTEYLGNEQSQDLKLTVNDIESVQPKSTEETITEGAYTITNDGIIMNINLEQLEDRVNLVIPKTIADIPVIGIEKTGRNVFDTYDNPENIMLPSGLKTIGREAFYRCTNPFNIILPDGLEKIGESAFEWGGLKNISIPDSVTEIERRAFYMCEDLETVKLPNQITVLKEGLFSEGYKLADMEIPETVTAIENDVFRSCHSLTNIKIPETVTEIGDQCFFGCNSLESVNLPDGLMRMGEAAFNGCSKLIEIKISEGITSLPGYKDSLTGADYGMFSGCTQLKNIILTDKMETMYEATFKWCRNIEKVMILSEKDDYDDHMNTLIQNIRNSESVPNFTQYLGRTLKTKQIKMNSFGENVYDLNDLIEEPVVYKYEDDGMTRTVSQDFELPSQYYLSGTPTSDETRLDTVNKKLYIGADENSILTLSASCQGKTVSMQIEAAPIQLKSIAVKLNPHQLTYRDGDIFNPEGLELKLIYNNGDEKDVSYQDEKENFTFDLSKLKTGDKSIKVTYQGKEAKIDIEVIRQLILADANKNLIEGIKESYIRGEDVSFQVKGDQQNNINPIRGDTRYLPLHWKVYETGNFNQDGKASLTTLGLGKQTLSVTFQLEEYDGNKWIIKGTDVKEKTFTIKEITPTINPDTPTNDKDNSSDFTISKDEITYDANRNVVNVDKYGNVIQTKDNSYIMLYAGVMLISGMIGYRVYKRCKELK